MKKIKVAQFVGSMNCGGTETMLMNIFREVDHKKYEFVFIENVEEECWYDKEILKLGGKIIKIKKNTPNYIKNLINLFKKEKFDVVHSHVFLHTGLVLYAAKKANVSVRVAHSHSAMRKSDNNIFKTLFLRNLILNNATHLVACSTEAGISLFGDKFKKNGITLPNPIRFKEIQNIKVSQVNILKQKYNISDNTMIIGHVGRLIEIKNHKFLIEIAQKLKQENIPFKMFFVGDGILKDEIVSKIKQYGLDQNIILTGNIDNLQVYEFMKMFDILLLPSFYEGLPVILVEAQASGLYSIVSSNVSKESDLGLELIEFEDIDNTESWLDKIKKFKKKKIKTNIISNVLTEKKYTVEESKKEYENIYKNTETTKCNIDSQKKNINHFLVPFIMSLLLAILAFFYYPITGDLKEYYSWMNKMLVFNNHDLFNYIFVHGEFIIMCYFFLIAKTGIYSLLQFFPTLIFYFIIFYIIFDYARANQISNKRKWLVILIFISLFKYIFIVSSFRYTLAYMIFAFGVYLEYIKKKKNTLFKLLYIFPIFIHISTIVLLVLKFLADIKNKYLRYSILLSVCFLMFFPKIPILLLSLFKDFSIIKYIIQKVEQYLIIEKVPLYLQYIFRIVQTILLSLIGFIVYKKRNDNYLEKYYVFFIVVSLFTISVTFFFTMYMRCLDFLLFLSPIILFEFFNIVDKLFKSQKVIMYFLIFIFIGIGIRIQIPILGDMYFRKDLFYEKGYHIYTNIQSR